MLMVPEPNEIFSHPLVSIIVPVHNGIKAGLVECINSIKNQNYTNLQIVLIDDKSSDGSLETARDLLSYSDNNVVIANKRNMGLSKNWNAGIENASGDYILLIHQDCRLSSADQLSKAVRYLELNKEYEGIIGSQVYDIREMNNSQKFIEFRLGHFFDSKCNELDVGLTENKCDLFRKNVFDKIGKFDEGVKNAGEDVIFSQRLSEHNIKIATDFKLSYIDALLDKNTVTKVLKREIIYGKVAPAVYLKFKGTKKNGRVNRVKEIRIANRMMTLANSSLISIFLILFSMNFFTFIDLLSIIAVASTRSLFVINYLQRSREEFPGLKLNIVYSLILTFVSDIVYSLSFLYGGLIYAVRGRV